METNHIPLANRTAEELLAKAQVLRQMAATATTMDVVTALLKLADRYEAMAKRRLA